VRPAGPVGLVSFLPDGHNEPVESVALSPDGLMAATASWDKTVKLWDLPSGKLIRTFTDHTDKVHVVAFSPDGQWILSGGWDRVPRLWSINVSGPVHRFETLKSTIAGVAFSPDGRQFAVSTGEENRSGPGKDCLIRIWDIATGKQLRQLEGHTQPIWAIAFSEDGSLLVSAGYDQTARVWDAETG